MQQSEEPLFGPNQDAQGTSETCVSNTAGDVCSLGHVRSLRPVRAIRRFTVRTVLPEQLAALDELAQNLRWSWHAPTRELFASIDPELWSDVRGDPVALLAALGSERLTALAASDEFTARVRAASDDLQHVPARPAVVPGADDDVGRRAAARHRLLLAGVRHHVGAAAVLRRPRHPGGRPPEERLRHGRADRRRRPAVRRRLLPAVADPRRVAGGDVPAARPGRPAARGPAGGRRHARRHLARPARRPQAARARLGRRRRPGAAAAARLERAGERRGGPQGHRPSLRRRRRSTGCSRSCCSAWAACARCVPGRG